MSSFFSLHQCSHLVALPLCGIIFLSLDKILGSPYTLIGNDLSQLMADANSLESALFLLYPLDSHVWKH